MPYDSWKPRKEHLKFFERVLNGHSKVSRFSKRDPQVFDVERREDLGSLVVLLTDLYSVGLADVIQAQDMVAGLNCIVTVSNWNGYTQDGKEYAKEHQIGLFVLSEFMGALWRRDFWEYVKLDDDGKPILYYRGQSA